MSVDLDSEQAPQLLQSLSAALAEIVTNPHTPPGLSATCFNIVAQLTSALASLSGAYQRQVGGWVFKPTRRRRLPSRRTRSSTTHCLPPYAYSAVSSCRPATTQHAGRQCPTCHAYIPACRSGTCWRPWCSRGYRLCVVCSAQTPQHGPPGRPSWLHCALAMQLRPTSTSPWQQRCRH